MDTRFIKALPSKKNPKYWYWNRPGHEKQKLPSEPAERAKVVTLLNKKADAAEGVLQFSNTPSTEAVIGSVAWVVDQYEKSDQYAKLSPGTTKYYKRFLSDIRVELGSFPFEAVDRAVVKEFIERYEAKSAPRHCAAVWRNLFNTAMDKQIVKDNRARDLRLPSPNRRTVVWERESMKRWLEVCATSDRASSLEIAFYLLMYTAQRVGDVLSMTRFQYQDGVLKLRQQKTNKLVAVPAHPELKAKLDAMLEANPCQTMLVDNNGKRMSYTRFLELFNDVKRRAGVEDFQPRDMRRTAMVLMAEGGATEIQIAAVSGHTIEQTRRILETYIPRTVSMAREGVAKLSYGI